MAQQSCSVWSGPAIVAALVLVACSPERVSEAVPAPGEDVVAAEIRGYKVISVTVSPQTAGVATGGRQSFRCTVTGTWDRACLWSVVEGASGGVITTRGAYTAPGTPGTYHVKAASHADRTKSAVATVTVSVPASVTLSISPPTAAVDSCGTQAFSATVTGTANTAVRWSVREGSTGGTIAASGVYTAPATAGTFHVIGKSAADTSKSASATVTVAEVIRSVAVSPAAVTVPAGGPAQLGATVTTSCGTYASGIGAGAPAAVTAP